MSSTSVAITVIRVVTYVPPWVAGAINGDIGINGISRSDVMRRALERYYAKRRPVA